MLQINKKACRKKSSGSAGLLWLSPGFSKAFNHYCDILNYGWIFCVQLLSASPHRHRCWAALAHRGHQSKHISLCDVTVLKFYLSLSITDVLWKKHVSRSTNKASSSSWVQSTFHWSQWQCNSLPFKKLHCSFCPVQSICLLFPQGEMSWHSWSPPFTGAVLQPKDTDIDWFHS